MPRASRARAGPVPQELRGLRPTLAAEQILERDEFVVDHETLRRWLWAAGLWKGSGKGQKHRSRRERCPCAVELVQLDGSPHAWPEGRGPRTSLVEFVDDATSLARGRFYPEEITEALMGRAGLRPHGIAVVGGAGNTGKRAGT